MAFFDRFLKRESAAEPPAQLKAVFDKIRDFLADETLQFSVGDRADTPQEVILDRFSKSEPQFREMANSFVLSNQWR